MPLVSRLLPRPSAGTEKPQGYPGGRIGAKDPGETILAYYIGLMSGTSRDGIDAVLTAIGDGRDARVIAHHHRAYPASLAMDLAEAVEQSELSAVTAGTLDARVGEQFARAATELLRAEGLTPGDVRGIGSHGQTLHHAPDAEPAFSWQIGDPFRIAERTGVDTVAMFRQRDIAAGGEGAPLACGFHAARFAQPGHDRAVVNIGGISNVTRLPPDGEVSGHDCGPGNTLLDHWVRHHRGCQYDADGAWARTGQVHPELLQALLADPYFQRPPPKSTGPEHFSPAWLVARGGQTLSTAKPADVQATLAELTAHAIARELVRPGNAPEDVLICGGGARNGFLLERLAAALPQTRIELTDACGIPAEQVEGAAFAWLAFRTLHHQSGNLPAVTGARGPRILGCVIPGG